MNNNVGSTNDPAHTCRHCRAVVIERPSQQQVDETEDGDIVPIAEIDGLSVLQAASDGCNFFKWAVTEFDKHEDRAEIDEKPDDWSLHGGVVKGHLDDNESSFPFVDFQWHREDGHKFYISTLAIIAEQGMIAQGCWVLPQSL